MVLANKRAPIHIFICQPFNSTYPFICERFVGQQVVVHQALCLHLHGDWTHDSKSRTNQPVLLRFRNLGNMVFIKACSCACRLDARNVTCAHFFSRVVASPLQQAGAHEPTCLVQIFAQTFGTDAFALVQFKLPIIKSLHLLPCAETREEFRQHQSHTGQANTNNANIHLNIGPKPYPNFVHGLIHRFGEGSYCFQPDQGGNRCTVTLFSTITPVGSLHVCKTYRKPVENMTIMTSFRFQ